MFGSSIPEDRRRRIAHRRQRDITRGRTHEPERVVSPNRVLHDRDVARFVSSNVPAACYNSLTLNVGGIKKGEVLMLMGNGTGLITQRLDMFESWGTHGPTGSH